MVARSSCCVVWVVRRGRGRVLRVDVVCDDESRGFKG